jgi:hypothetical protein
MQLWSVSRDDALGLYAQPVDPGIARGLFLIWAGSDPMAPHAADAAKYLVEQRDRFRHLLCGCTGKNLAAAPRLLCKRIGINGATFLSRDSTRVEHDARCPYFREDWTNSDCPQITPAARTAREYELTDLFMGIGGAAAAGMSSTPLPRRRSDISIDGNSRPSSIATALDLIFELSGLNNACVPYPIDRYGSRIFPEQTVHESLKTVRHPSLGQYKLSDICLVQPSTLATAPNDVYTSARRSWRGRGSPVGYLIFVCEDIINDSGRSVVYYRTGTDVSSVALNFKVPCARQNVDGPFVVLCKVGIPGNTLEPVILEAASQAVAARSDWWAIDSNWERDSYRNLRHVLRAAADEGIVISAWRPLRWLTARNGGLFLPDYWVRCRSSWGCWHNFFVEIEGTRNAAGQAMKERTIARAQTRGTVWRENRLGGLRARDDRLQRSTILEWARWACSAPPQATSDPD